MGNGLILESGVHDELLADENSAYARLVQAQKLRESSAQRDGDHEEPEGSKTEGDEDDSSQTVEDPDLMLSRVGSKRSLASEALEQRRQAQAAEKDYSFPYLFRRMGAINRDNWPRYMAGFIAAASASFPELVQT